GRAREPPPGAGHRALRRRARLRAGTAKPLLPGAARGREPGGRDVSLRRAPLLSAGPRPARKAAWPNRRVARDVAGDRRRRRAPFPWRLPGRLRGSRHVAVRARRPTEADRARVAPDRA